MVRATQAFFAFNAGNRVLRVWQEGINGFVRKMCQTYKSR